MVFSFENESSAPSVVEGLFIFTLPRYFILFLVYYVYMIKNSYNNVYIGVTDDPERRLREHNSKRGAGFTKFKDTFCIVFLEQYMTLAQARQREIQIKKWSRKKKEMLIKRYALDLETRLRNDAKTDGL